MSAITTATMLDLERGQRKALRKLYLALFLRGRSARALEHKSAPKTVARKLAFALLFYVLYGAFALFFSQQSVLLLSGYLHGMTFMLLSMFIASSAGEVLFNKEEADILLHRPVSAKALLRAKIGVMIQVAMWLALALNLVGLFVGVWSLDGGWAYPIVHLVSIFLETLFCAGLIVMSYQLCLRWLGRERLDGLMTTAQVFLMIFLIVGGQILPRVLGNLTRSGTVHLESLWFALLPPMWFAGLDAAIVGSGSTLAWVMAAMGMVATVVVLYFAFAKLAATYESGLQKVGENLPQKPQSLKRRWTHALLKLPPFAWWFRDPVTRASFLLTTAYMLRDRETKLRLYPGLAPVVMMPAIFLLQGQGRGGAGDGFGLAFAGCYLGLVPMLAQNILQYSQQWAAADLFRVVPMNGPGALCHGARKATLLYLTLPMVVVVAGLCIAMRAPIESLVLFLPGLLTVPIFALVPAWMGRNVPLSQPPEDAKAANRGLSMMLMILVAVALSVVVNLAWRLGWFWWFVGVETLVVAIVYLWGRRRLDRLRWERVE